MTQHCKLQGKWGWWFWSSKNKNLIWCAFPKFVNAGNSWCFRQVVSKHRYSALKKRCIFRLACTKMKKTLKSAIGQKGPHPPYSSSKQAAQKQLTTKKRREGRGVKKGMHFLFLAWIFSTKFCIWIHRNSMVRTALTHQTLQMHQDQRWQAVAVEGKGWTRIIQYGIPKDYCTVDCKKSPMKEIKGQSVSVPGCCLSWVPSFFKKGCCLCQGEWGPVQLNFSWLPVCFFFHSALASRELPFSYK